MARTDRQSKILELVAENNIETQDGLTALLKACGYDVTQATVSRDVKELGLIKTAFGDGYKYAAANTRQTRAADADKNPNPSLSAKRAALFKGAVGEDYADAEKDQNLSLSAKRAALFKEAVVGVDYAENIIVIKTIGGSANSAAALIDSLKEPSILGSVAGDDTIFVVVKSAEAVKGVMDLFKTFTE
jgi:transcriptional regulator of arginine metabolism